MESLYLTIGQVSTLLGLCTKTLRRWDQDVLLIPDFRTIGGHRRYSRKRVLGLFQKKGKEPFKQEAMKKTAIYGRVSSSKQKKSKKINIFKLNKFIID